MESNPIFIGIAGGSGSGKTHLAKAVRSAVGEDAVSIVSMDQYFVGLPDAQDPRRTNFDHPALLDLDLMFADLANLKAGRSVLAPDYDFASLRSTPRAIEVPATPIILIEGLFVLTDPLHHALDLSCYLEVAADQRLLGRILRDVKERASTLEEIVDRYQRFVRPSYEVFVAPTKHNADIVVDFAYRRAFFTEMLVELCEDYVHRDLNLRDFAAKVKRESLPIGYRPEEGMMPRSIDLRTLAQAYPPTAEWHPFSQTQDPTFDLKLSP